MDGDVLANAITPTYPYMLFSCSQHIAERLYLHHGTKKKTPSPFCQLSSVEQAFEATGGALLNQPWSQSRPVTQRGPARDQNRDHDDDGSEIIIPMGNMVVVSPPGHSRLIHTCTLDTNLPSVHQEKQERELPVRAKNISHGGERKQRTWCGDDRLQFLKTETGTPLRSRTHTYEGAELLGPCGDGTCRGGGGSSGHRGRDGFWEGIMTSELEGFGV
ncbi:hypothetical protein BXZ70DRAFT_903131 [Cristinia sonorae]|uniref:Uncharacterized protein n=1 Tax=Cristinia sonorae TaxID=1940300 RepID=A0A8K0UZ97_9AGAR|nr:hypothetical protein BXZ70DRAFT_903131 [Cristinia sonorae]